MWEREENKNICTNREQANPRSCQRGKSKGKVGAASHQSLLSFMCTHLWPRIALAKPRQTQAAPNSCPHQLCQPRACAQFRASCSFAKSCKSPGNLAGFDSVREMPVPVHGVKIPATITVSQHRQQSKAREHVFLSPLRFNNCSRFTQQLFRFHCHTAKKKKKKGSKKATSWALSAGQLSP